MGISLIWPLALLFLSFIITSEHFPIAPDSLTAFLLFLPQTIKGAMSASLLGESQHTLNGFKWHKRMFNDVQSSDLQCFISL